MAVCIEDLADVAGFSPFEQYIYRTAAEREQKHDAPSQPGDLDLTIYSLRKFLRLACHGNPTILTLLFVPADQQKPTMHAYVCAECGGTFNDGWLDEEAQAESVATFGVRGDAPGMAKICDV